MNLSNLTCLPKVAVLLSTELVQKMMGCIVTGKNMDEHFTTHTSIPWFAFSDRSTKKGFRLNTVLLRSTAPACLP